MLDLLWTGALRLAVLVTGALAGAAVPFAMDGGIRTVPAVTGALALTLLVMAVWPLARARRLRDQASRGDLVPARAPSPYRRNARMRSTASEPGAGQATRLAAAAFFLLSVAVSLTVVAAAAR